MAYRNHYSGSPWQQGGPPFNVSNYGQNYSTYNDQYSMMSTGYGRSQSGYGGMYGSGGGSGGGSMSQMRSMGYGGPSPSRYGNDRMSGGRQMMPRGQMQRKRLPQRSPAGGPRSKRPNLSGNDRRMSKPRRRRDSRGGSKGRGREHSDDEGEDDTYNPAEPTDDASDVECDGYESWKASSEDEAESAKAATKENGEQDTENAEGEKTEDSKAGSKKFVCYVCKVTCSGENIYRKHQASKSHTSKIDDLLAVRREKKQAVGDEDKDTDKDKDGKKRSSSRKPGNWCTVCECAFNGNFLAHRRTKEHRKKRDKKYPKCRPCRLGFSSSEEYRDHYKSEDHKVKSAEFHYLKGLLSGSDEDEAAIEPIKIESDDEKCEEEIKIETEQDAEVKVKEEKIDTEEGDGKANEEKTDDSAEKSDASTAEKKEEPKKEDESKSAEAKKSKPREPKAHGQSFVVSVQGYYCKLCRKFFKDITVAKSKHCRSIMHVTAFKKAMDEALEQEEERQKLADEQDKLDQKATEEAELAAEIIAIERAAKEAAKKEAAKKKAGKSDNVEMKDVTDQAEGGGAAASSKAETNGIKSTDANADKDEDKSMSDDKPMEAQEESAEGDEEGDEEQEKEVTKEEVTTSPATRRGRGRGRGRKRR